MTVAVIEAGMMTTLSPDWTKPEPTRPATLKPEPTLVNTSDTFRRNGLSMGLTGGLNLSGIKEEIVF